MADFTISSAGGIAHLIWPWLRAVELENLNKMEETKVTKWLPMKKTKPVMRREAKPSND